MADQGVTNQKTTKKTDQDDSSSPSNHNSIMDDEVDMNIIDNGDQSDENSAECLDKNDPDFQNLYLNNNQDDSEQDDDDWEDTNMDDNGFSPINLPSERHFRQFDGFEDILDRDDAYQFSATRTQIQGLELYGFFIWNLTSILYMIFLVWAYVPQHVLEDMGIRYIPSKYFALGIPVWLIGSIIILVQAYAASGLYFSHNKDSYLTMQDKGTVLAHPKEIEEDTCQTDKDQQMGNSCGDDQPDNAIKLKEVQNQQSSTQLSNNDSIRKKRLQTTNSSASNGIGQIMRKQRSYRMEKNQSTTSFLVNGSVSRGSRGVDTHNKSSVPANYYNKIPDLFELPITVVNNVLYMPRNKKDE